MRPAPPVESSRVPELLAELLSVQKELSEKSVELGKVVSERNALRDRLVRAENSARELSSALAAEARLRGEVMDAHVANNAALRSRVSELELLLDRAKSAKSAPVSIEAADLRRIRGIGPAYERALIALGINGVAQLAQLSREEIVRIAPLIKAQPDRILRDDWLGQAQRLQSEQPDK
jgi:large subunit ribosomal protein L21